MPIMNGIFICNFIFARRRENMRLKTAQTVFCRGNRALTEKNINRVVKTPTGKIKFDNCIR